MVSPNCAGIGIGRDSHCVAIGPERFPEPVRRFGTLTEDLGELAAFPGRNGVTEVAMEPTGVYWIPAYGCPERAGFPAIPAPPELTRRIGGRRSDALDCRWPWGLRAHGLPRGCFRPPDAHGAFRSLVRQGRHLTEGPSRCALRIRKALTEMDVRLGSAIGDIIGGTGQRILRATVDSGRDPDVPASLRDPRIRAPRSRTAPGLEGTWRRGHLSAPERGCGATVSRPCGPMPVTGRS